MTHRFIGLAAAVIVAAAPFAASATTYNRHGYVAPPQPAPVFGAESYSDECVPACQQDYAPCDPAYFKRADARCQVWPGRHEGGHNR